MAPSTARTTTVLSRRIEWKDIKDQVDLARVAGAEGEEFQPVRSKLAERNLPVAAVVD